MMDRLRWLLLVTLFSVILPTFVWAQSPRVAIEVAIVERTNLAEGAIGLADELKNALADADLDEHGLLPFLQQWRTGTKETPVTIQAMRVKTELGAQVEVQTQRILDPDPRDEEGARPDRLTRHVGMDAAFRAEQTNDGKIRLDCRFGKNTHDGGTARYPDPKQEGMVTRPRVGIMQMTAVIMLEPDQAFVSDAMRHASMIDGERIRSEICFVYLARMSEAESR